MSSLSVRLRWKTVAVCVSALIASIGAPSESRAAEPTVKLETVFPEIPGKNQVRWWEFDWKWATFAPVPGGAPVKLYFYEEEREVAQLAKPMISQAYQDYVTAFAYKPETPIPFLLYNSHAEFESTTAFLVSEGVLGVTNPQDLTMALPYWGEHQRFDHVMRHELAHQFNIQKVDSASKCKALQLFPLWFIEGLAEYYSQNKLTPEVRAALADGMLYRKDSESRYKKRLPDFFDDEPMTFERVYLIGHAQVRFLEETYGAGTLLKIMARSSELCEGLSFFSGPKSTFADYVLKIVGQKKGGLEKAWLAWVASRVSSAREAKQDLSSLNVVGGIQKGLLDTFVLSPDGRLILYRVLDLNSGVTRLYLRDLSDPKSEVLVAADRGMSLESLHPLDRRGMALGNHQLVYIGRSGSSDRIWVRKFKRETRHGRVRLHLGRKKRHSISSYDGLIEAGWPAIDPASGAIVFVGLSRKTGMLDIFRIRRPFSGDAPVVRVTHDVYAEQGLAFDQSGNLLLASDATPEGHTAIFSLSPDGIRTPLTHLPPDVNALAPEPDGNGGFFFTSDLNGWQEVYESARGGTETTRITDVPTEILNPALDADGNLLGIALIDTERKLVRVPPEQWVHVPVTAPTFAGPVTAIVLPREKLGPVQKYNARSPRNFRLAAAQLGGATGSFLIGNVIFTDLFKSQIAGVSAEILGGLDQSNFEAFYLDRSGRWGKGGSLFTRTGIQLEPHFTSHRNTYLLRRFGGSLLAEYPFGRFTRIEAHLSPQGIQAFNFENPRLAFAKENAGVYPALELGGRFGLDNLRLSRFGPIGGSSFSWDAAGTWIFGGPDPFARTTVDFQTYYALLRGYDRLNVIGRLAAGTSAGGAFREQFYLPAAYNLRALPEGVIKLLGEHYWAAQTELHFPLGKAGKIFYLEGVAGADAGAVTFQRGNAWADRVAAGVVGVNVGVTPLVIRVHVARPFGIGGAAPVREFLWHVSLAILPFE